MRLRGGILVFAFLVGLSQTLCAQTGDWPVLKQLLPGQKVKIQLVNGKARGGTVRSVSDDAILVGRGQSIQKQEIRQILLRSPGHHGRNALIGLGIGGGFGLAAGVSCDGKGWNPSRGACMSVGAAFFGGIGAGIGALVPSHGAWRDVYRAP